MTTNEAFRRNVYLFAIYAGALLLGFFPLLRGLVADWWSDPDQSHGFIVPLVSGYIIWQKRESLSSFSPAEGTLPGSLLLLLAALTYHFGRVGSLEYAVRIGFLLWLYGSAIFLFGLHIFRKLLFPMLFLIFMVPLPYTVYDTIAFPLKLISSNIASSLLQFIGIPAYLEGNVIFLPTMVLEVADACSGIRSLSSLLAVTSVATYLSNRTNTVRTAVLMFSIPVAVASNSLRIIGTGVLVAMGHQRVAEGFFHMFSGWLVFVMSLFLVLSACRLGSLIEKRV